jgi:hypothetical protein
MLKVTLSGAARANRNLGQRGQDLVHEPHQKSRNRSQMHCDAVRQWKFEPFLLNSELIEVKTTINITYSLKK